MTPAYRELAAREPVFVRLVAEYGQPSPFEWHDGKRTATSRFAAMLLHIVGQQISARVAFTVYDRIATAVGGIPTPDTVVALGAEQLRECGLSTAKARYALALADSQINGVFDIEHLDGADDATILATLTAVRGIGVWTAETFLVHNMHRPDVLPAGDLGIRQAVRRLWALDGLPSVQEVRAQAAAWSPYRTYAAALLWRSLTPPGEPSDPKERALGG
jgi:3-methyladenine DNA glycosylase/8-oxoguanine DNA glycosylase